MQINAIFPNKIEQRTDLEYQKPMMPITKPWLPRSKPWIARKNYSQKTLFEEKLKKLIEDDEPMFENICNLSL